VSNDQVILDEKLSIKTPRPFWKSKKISERKSFRTSDTGINDVLLE